MERPCFGQKGRIYLDIWIKLEGKRIGLELKYKSKQFENSIDNEEFRLRHQSAQDIARYDLISDLQRTEGLIEANRLDNGFTIFLTNDPGYWKGSGRRNRVDEDFRIREGRTISGHLAWADHTSDGTKRGREDPISISGKYITSWCPYSEIKSNSFQYLLFDAKV